MKKIKKIKIANVSKAQRSALWTRVSVNLSQKEKMLFTKHLSVLLGAGLPVSESLETLQEQATGSSKKILTSLKDTVEEGNTLASGFEKFPHIFPSVFVSLVSAGEASGTLQRNLEYLSEHMEKVYELRKQIIGVMIYPAIVLVGSLGVGFGLTKYVLPNIVNMFRSFKVDLPLATRMVLWTAEFAEVYGARIFFGAIAVAIVFAFVRRMKKVKIVTHWVALQVPLVGRFSKQVNLAALTRVMGTLLKSGVSMSEVLAISLPTLNNVYFQKILMDAQAEIAKGNALSDAFKKYPRRMPAIAQRLIEVGEKSGTLDEMFLYLADFYELEVQSLTKYMAHLFEPVLVVLIGLVVFVLAIAIVSPMYQILGSI